MSRSRPRGRESAHLRDVFWARAAAHGLKDPSPLRAGMLLHCLKEVIQFDAARWMAFQDQVPAAVVFVIAVVGLVAGHTFGLSGVRQPFSMCMLSLAITMVLGIIVDLDRPRESLIRVSQQPLLDLQEQLGSR